MAGRKPESRSGGANGAILWQVRLSSVGEVTVTRVRTDGTGNIYLSGGAPRPDYPVGTFVAKLDPNRALVWQNGLGKTSYSTDPYGNPANPTYDIPAGDYFLNLSITPDGGVIAGTSLATQMYNTVHNSPLVARYGPDGALKFVRNFGYPGEGTDSKPAWAACQSLDGSH